MRPHKSSSQGSNTILGWAGKGAVFSQRQNRAACVSCWDHWARGGQESCAQGEGLVFPREFQGDVVPALQQDLALKGDTSTFYITLTSGNDGVAALYPHKASASEGMGGVRGGVRS